MIVHFTTCPESFIEGQKKSFLASREQARSFVVRVDHEQYYLPGEPFISLLGCVCLTRNADGCEVSFAILPESPALLTQLEALPDDLAALRELVKENASPWLNAVSPLLLEPIAIAKPWGKEIWYTGIEVRGQSSVKVDSLTVPLPWVLSFMPQALVAGCERELILLKILDPLPEEVYGDLYFEMHKRKREVYIVTHVHPEAWPDGTGGIRLGFNETKRATFVDDEAFKAAYLKAVKQYEHVRRDIDRRLDEKRSAALIALDAPVDAQQLKAWQQELPEDLLMQECTTRAAMDAFTAIHPLRVGDVVKVPCLTPHALQHGVRTIEFQTPVYERQILSFAQKVLTQSHWDTAAALPYIQLDTPVQPPLQLLSANAESRIERVVTFDDFEVLRISLQPHGSYTLERSETYCVVMVIAGEVAARINHKQDIACQFAPGEASLFPANMTSAQLTASSEGAIVLLALPTSGQ